jgi:hypothetical protein
VIVVGLVLLALAVTSGVLGAVVGLAAGRLVLAAFGARPPRRRGVAPAALPSEWGRRSLESPLLTDDEGDVAPPQPRIRRRRPSATVPLERFPAADRAAIVDAFYRLGIR